MHYYIDGYNVLFRILHSGEDLRTQRQVLINDLQTKNKLLQLQFTLVFDSHFQAEDSTSTHLDNLKIVYTAKGETADEYIFQELKGISAPSQHTVVTSDKKLAWLCRRRLAKTETVEEFIAWLNKRYQNKLRQQKVSKVPSQLPPPPAPTAPKALLPTKQETAETCFDYYLETFEKLNTIQQLENQKIPSPTTKKAPKHKKDKQSEPKEDPLLSDFQRWLNAFEHSTDDSEGL